VLCASQPTTLRENRNWLVEERKMVRLKTRNPLFIFPTEQPTSGPKSQQNTTEESDVSDEHTHKWYALMHGLLCTAAV
jgi:hypothetical protein